MEIKIFQKNKTVFKKENESNKIDIFWHFLLYVLLFSIISAGFFGYNIFRKINKDTDSFNTNNNVSNIETVKKERVENSLKIFSAREEESKIILEKVLSIIDPML